MSLLGGIGEALSSYAHGDLVARHDQDDRKRQQEQIQLEGIRSLLAQNDLPMEVYTHAIGALADLTGNKPTKQVADLLYQHLGDHQTIDQVNPQAATPGTQAARVESSIGPPPPMTQVSRETIGETPRNVYTANALLPAQIAKYNAQQAEKARYDAENDARTEARQVKVQTLKGQQALARLPMLLENRLKIVDATHQAKVREDVDKLIAKGLTPEEATNTALEQVQQESALRAARVNLLQANVAAIPERIAQGWANVDANQLRTEIAGDVANRGADMAAFDRDTSWAFKDLDHVNRELSALQRQPDDKRAGDWADQVRGLQSQKDTLLNQIYINKGKYVPSEAAPPRRGLSSPPSGRGTRYVAPRVSRDKLQQLMQP